MSIGIISGAAVWVSRVTVALDDAGVFSALVSYGPSRELMCKLLASALKVRENWRTYTLSGTSADIVREAMDKGRSAHENHSLDGLVCRSGKSTSTVSLISNLSTLTVTQEHNLGIGAGSGVCVNLALDV